MLECPPGASVEPPPSPELHRRGEEKQREVEPPHRDREHKPEHVRQAAEEDERRECGCEQEVALELSVLALVGVLDRGVLPHHPIACTLDGLLQVSWLHFAREVLDCRPLVGEVDARLGNTFLFGESPLYSPHAGGAGHPHHRDGDPREPFILVGRLHAGLPAFTLVRVSVMLYPPTPYVKLTLPLEASCGDRYAYDSFEHSSAPSTHSSEQRVAYGLTCRGTEIVATAASEDA